MTFSIVALDPATGDLGVAVQSKFLAVGAVVPWAIAGVGGIATQSFANVTYGPEGLAALAAGASAQQVLDQLVAGDKLREQRQAGIVDAHGGSATFTGRGCLAWAGGRTGPGYAAQGNILAGASVVDAIVDTYLGGGKPFPELLVECLLAADQAGVAAGAAGGDRRGRESAALLVVRTNGGYGGGNDRWIDLRVDQHDDPINELARVMTLQRLYLDRPTEAELRPLDAGLALEIRGHLESLGAGPGGWTTQVYQPNDPTYEPEPTTDEDGQRPYTGTPGPLPEGWNDDWQAALVQWMGVANLEERNAAPGWIDPRVLEVLRDKAGAAR
jgi:uncharacterized Ntn-hydrolase superfamily protein